MIKDLNKLYSTVASFQAGKPLDKYISEVTLPNFKNIEPGTRITFDYPLTALVGANGSGKSSVLHALWGAPARYSTSRFWFPTDLDPISEGGEYGIYRYHYTHWVSELKMSVQTKKVRGKKRLGYWEPARASTVDGMNPMPDENAEHAPYRSKDRWNPVEREVIYLNFKCEFSAFDRYFYFASRDITLDARQEHIQRGARRLKKVIENNFKSYSPGGKQSIFENRELTDEELNWVNYVLGNDYLRARYVLHRLYGGMEAPSVIFERKAITYSEAYAGSGELAVVRAVVEILNAKKYALLLLDEPETSLHPQAQSQLIYFLLEQIRTKHVQVVISTHSPTVVNALPVRAIRVFEESPSGRMHVGEISHRQVAFNRLGHTQKNSLDLVVEDQLLCELVKVAIKLLDKGEAEAISLHVPASGAEAILKYSVPTWLTHKQDMYVLLDGDKEPKKNLPDPDSLSLAEQRKLADVINETFGLVPFGCSVGQAEPAASYVRWAREKLRFLDAICPEYVILSAIVGEHEANVRAQTNQGAKDALIAELKSMGLETNAEFICNFAQIKLIPLKDTNRHILKLRDVLKGFLLLHGSRGTGS